MRQRAERNTKANMEIIKSNQIKNNKNRSSRGCCSTLSTHPSALSPICNVKKKEKQIYKLNQKYLKSDAEESEEIFWTCCASTEIYSCTGAAILVSACLSVDRPHQPGFPFQPELSLPSHVLQQHRRLRD